MLLPCGTSPEPSPSSVPRAWPTDVPASLGHTARSLSPLNGYLKLFLNRSFRRRLGGELVVGMSADPRSFDLRVRFVSVCVSVFC